MLTETRRLLPADAPSMILRRLLRDCREFPATTSFCLIWIAVFTAMAAIQIADGASIPWTRWLFSGIGGGHRFGDLTLPEIARGEVWRLVTCTFVHYSILHIGLNLLAMYQLGTMVESWYGSPQFVFIYGVIASLGNLIAIAVRAANSSGPPVHSGGGSVVILGLVGLGAVVGWRLHSPMGTLLYRQMVIVLVLTGLVGIALPRYIDNWGHAGGALVGALVGFGHKLLLRGVSKPRAWGAGLLTGFAIVLCGAAQAVADRREAPARLEAQAMEAVRRVAELERLSRGLELTRRLAAHGGDVQQMRGILVLLKTDIDRTTNAGIRQLRAMLEGSQAGIASNPKRQQFQDQLAGLIDQVHRQYRAERRRLTQIRSMPEYRRRAAR
jgi:rhomboid protease GluP